MDVNEIKTEKQINSLILKQTLHILPSHLQADGECRCCQVSPLLPLFPQTNKTRVHMETDGSGALKPDLPDVPRLDSARCTGCGRCVAACTLHLITLEVSGFRKCAVLNNAGQCTRCGECVKSCLLNAVETAGAALPVRSKREIKRPDEHSKEKPCSAKQKRQASADRKLQYFY